MNERDAFYFRTRAQEERRAADSAGDGKAREAHLSLAACYEKAATGELPLEQLHEDADAPDWSRPVTIIGSAVTNGGC